MSEVDTLTAGLFALALAPEGGGEEDGDGAAVAVPLLSVDVEAEAVHVAARVSVKQVYANDQDVPLEAVYR